jgi:hypothetical protein
VKFWAIVLVLSAGLFPASEASGPSDAASMQRKLDHIEKNGRLPHPSTTPTVFSEREINAYMVSDNVQLPAGVESVKLVGEGGVVTGTTHVDFDKVRAGVRSSNPLLSMFSGVHDVVVVTHARGENGTGYVHVDSVSIDGVEVPHFVLELFVEKYLTPKYPEIGLDSKFALPDRVDTATVGEHELTVVQK